MSTNVLIIPEDFTKDQYVLKPIIEKMMASIGFPRARVTVCKDPRLQGVAEATDKQKLTAIIERYQGKYQVFLLIIDRDCKESRRAKLDHIEQEMAEKLKANNVFFAENAWQEVEVWLLAGQKDLPSGWNWKEIRAECDPKEKYYDAYVKQRDAFGYPFEGRVLLGKQAAQNYPRIRQLCPEDVQALENRLKEALRK